MAAEVEHRNHIWQADHKQLNVSVLAPGQSNIPKKPWLTYFLDAFSRAIMGWAISLQPNQSVVLAAFRQAILHNPQRGPFYGRPRILYIDHGLEFVADAVTECCSVIGTCGVVLPPYSPQQKGRIERAHRTIITRFLQGLPAFTGGATDARGRPVISSGKPLPLQVLLGEFTKWVHDYNHERPHRALGSRPPVVAWEEDPTPIVDVEERRLDRYMLRGETRVVRRGKIEFASDFYVGGLAHYNGSQVEVRWDTEDMRTIEVYLDEQHLCTAVAESKATSEQLEAYIHDARAEEAGIRRDLRTAKRRTRRRYKAMVDDSAIVENDDGPRRRPGPPEPLLPPQDQRPGRASRPAGKNALSIVQDLPGLAERAARLSAPSPFNVPGASIIQTDHLLLARDNLLDICEELAMGAFWGPAGVGKSYALLEASGQVRQMPVTWIEFGHRPTMRHVTIELLGKLGYDGPMGSKHDMINPSEVCFRLRGCW